MSMEARMTDSTAGNQTKIAWPRLTRHINKHAQAKLTRADAGVGKGVGRGASATHTQKGGK